MDKLTHIGLDVHKDTFAVAAAPRRNGGPRAEESVVARVSDHS